jgi:hypothetical protein
VRKGPRKRSEPELVGAAEAAELCGTKPSNLGQLRGLPDQYDKIRATTLWRREEMEKFAQELDERRHPAAA